MKHLEVVGSAAFGIVFIGLSIAVTVETLSRKLFNISLQGVDELGGYCLAIGGALAFTIAISARAHIRIDIVYDLMPRGVRVALNILSVATLAISAVVLLWMAWTSFADSLAFGSTAQTPWATPLQYPQALWVAALGAFTIVSVVQLGQVGFYAMTGRLKEIDSEFSPRGAKEELKEELEDIKHRGATALDVERGAVL